MNFSNYSKTVLFNYLSIGANVLTGFILFPLIVDHLGLEALGVFGIFYSIKSIIDIGMGWLSGSIIKNLIRYKYLKYNIATFSFFINFIYGFLCAIIIILYGYFEKTDYFMSSIYFSIFILVSFVYIPYTQLLISNMKQQEVAFFKLLSQTFFMILSISVFLIAEDKSLDIIFIVLAIVNIIILITMHIYYNLKFKFYFVFTKINKKLIYKLFISDGNKFFFTGLSTILLLQIDVLLIDYLYGSESTAIYLILWKIPNTFIMLGWRLSDPFQAIVAKNISKSKESLKKQFFSLEKKIFILSIIVAVCYNIFGSYLLDFWIGKNNIPDIAYMYFFPAFLIVFSVMQRLYMSVNYYTEGLELVSKLQFIEIVFKVFFIIFAFKYFQELASIVGWFISFLLTIWLYRRNSLKVWGA